MKEDIKNINCIRFHIHKTLNRGHQPSGRKHIGGSWRGGGMLGGTGERLPGAQGKLEAMETVITLIVVVVASLVYSCIKTYQWYISIMSGLVHVNLISLKL